MSIYRGHIWYDTACSTMITLIKFMTDLHSRTTPHTSASRASYGVSLVSCTKKNARDASRAHCTVLIENRRDDCRLNAVIVISQPDDAEILHCRRTCLSYIHDTWKKNDRWLPGDLKKQLIGNHNIDLVITVYYVLKHQGYPLGLYTLSQMSLWHDDVIKWKHFPRYWPFVRGIHRSPANSPHKGQWRGAYMLFVICAWKTVE